MAWLIPSPREAIGTARALADWSLETAVLAATLPARLGSAITEAELLLQRVSKVVDEVEATVGEARTVAMDARAVVGVAELVAGQARTVVGDARAVALEAGTVVGAARTVALEAGTVVGDARDVALAAGTVVGDARTVALEAADVVGTARVVAGDAGTVVGTAQGVALNARDVVGTAQGVAEAAGDLVINGQLMSAQAQQLLDLYRPLAQQAAPQLRAFVNALSDREVRAVIRFVDHLPVLVEHLESDVLPILETLDRVGPDVSNLLEVAKDVREAAVGIPGFKFFRKRGEQKIEDDEDEAGPIRTEPAPGAPAAREDLDQSR